MNVLAVIPARGGSKSVPRKNISAICGRPLIEYTILEALKCKYLSDIVVSTDDNEIAEIARELGAQVPFMRPQELATDSAESAPVMEHALLGMEDLKGKQYDAILMLQPTTPLRRVKHIDQAIRLFISEECDSVVSVVSVGGHHPFRMKRMAGKKLINYIDQGCWDMRPRQDLPLVYIRNGAIYLISRKAFLKGRQLLGKNCLGFEMTEEESINIDTPVDFLAAEAMLKDQEK